MPEIRFTERMATMMLAAADKRTRAKVIGRMKKPVHDEIRKNYDHILSVAPTVHFLPFSPQDGKEKEVEKHLKEALKWLKDNDSVYSTFLYHLAGGNSNDQSPPKYLLVMLCEDSEVMKGLLRSSKGNKIQKDLMKVCKGKSATEEGEMGINTMLMGIV